MRFIGSAIFMLSLRHATILKFLRGTLSSSSLERHPKVNSFSSRRSVASVGDPSNRGEHLGDSVVTSNALLRPLPIGAKKTATQTT